MMVVPIGCHLLGNSLSVTQKRKLARAHVERLRVATEFQVLRLGVGLFFCAEVIKEQKSQESSCNQLWEGAEASALQSVLQNARLWMKTNWKRAYSCSFTPSGNTDCYMLYLTNPPHHTYVGWHLWAFQQYKRSLLGQKNKNSGMQIAKPLPFMKILQQLAHQVLPYLDWAFTYFHGKCWYLYWEHPALPKFICLIRTLLSDLPKSFRYCAGTYPHPSPLSVYFLIWVILYLSTVTGFSRQACKPLSSTSRLPAVGFDRCLFK